MFIKVNLQFFAEGDPADPADPADPTKPAEKQQKDLTPEEVLDIKNNFVKKDVYDQLKDQYGQLVKSVLEGGDLPADVNPDGEKGVDKAKLRKELYDPNNSMTNLEYVEKTLKLRKQIIADGGSDPFLPKGINGNPFENDQQQQAAERSAAKVAEVLENAVKEADGDPATFDVIMSKIVI